MHEGLDHPVAIKEFYPQAYALREGITGHLSVPARDREMYDRGLARFTREGRLLVRLNHPGIVRVTDLFEERGTAYLVMDLLVGRTLRNELDNRPNRRFPPGRTRTLVGKLVSALQAVHTAGIYHLDIKPDNVMVTSDHRPVLVDFGASRQGFGGRSTQVFTMEYAPIEVLAGQEVGPQSDLFELGMMTHELLTGKRPPAALARLTGDDWSPSGLGEPWEELLTQALQIRREDRPANLRRWWALHALSDRALIVAADGSGTHATLAKALADAPAGATIRVRAGVHHLPEGMRIDRAVSLIGDGTDATEITADRGLYVLLYEGAGRFALRDLTVRWTGSEKANAVVLTGGEALIENCRFGGATEDEPTTRAGISFRGDARGLMRGCEASGNRFGIYVAGEAQPTLERNTCERNEYAGIHVGEQAQPTLINNTCSDNKSDGIAYSGNAGGTARDNTCQHNKYDGISVGEQAQPDLVGNACSSNGSIGIDYIGNAGGTARDNICEHNEHDGISVGGQAQPTLLHNICSDSHLAGIDYIGDAGGTARDNTCERNELFGISVGEQAQPTLINNICSDNRSYGIAYTGSAGGTARDNICEHNEYDGISVGGQAQPTLGRNVYRGNGGIGLNDVSGRQEDRPDNPPKSPLSSDAADAPSTVVPDTPFTAEQLERMLAPLTSTAPFIKVEGTWGSRSG